MLIDCPKEVLSLLHAADTEERSTRWSLCRVQFGRDEVGPWAAATDTRIAVLMRWKGGGELVAAFGVRAAGVAAVAKVAESWGGLTVSSPTDGLVCFMPSGGAIHATAAMTVAAAEGRFPPVQQVIDETRGKPETGTDATQKGLFSMAYAGRLASFLGSLSGEDNDEELVVKCRFRDGVVALIDVSEPMSSPRGLHVAIAVSQIEVHKPEDYPHASDN